MSTSAQRLPKTDTFEQLLNANEEDILRTLYRFRLFKPRPDQSKTDYISKRLKLTPAQLLCALGFNIHTAELSEIYPILGLPEHDALLKQRDLFYTKDVYKQISLKNLLAVYKRIQYENAILFTISQLIKNRLHTIEQKIEATVSSPIIDRYKAEIKAIYFDKIVDVDFIEDRLNVTDSGYRALLNEVPMIAESNIIPADDIYLQYRLLLEERRKLLQRGMISDETVQLRLKDSSISDEEQDLLQEHLKNNY